METENKRGGLKTYQAFTPPSPYEQERRKAEQMRRYAELLQEQAAAEDEPFTYQGFRAMPSPAAALGKLLKAYGSKKAGEKAEEAEQKAREADLQGFETLRRELGPQQQIMEPDMFADPMQMDSKYTLPQMLGREPQVGIEAIMEASPESRRRYKETRDPFALEKPAKSPEMTSDMQNYQFYVLQETNAGRTPKSFEQFQAAKRSSTNITNVLPSEKTTAAYTTALSGKLADQDAADLALGEQSLPQIDASFRVRDLLKQNPITGTGANARLAFERALATAGFSKGQKASVTENLAAELGKVTLAAIPTSGLGSGQGFTGGDREFLEKAAAGTLELTNANLQYLAELNEKVARANIQRSNRTRSRLRKIPEFSGLGDRFPNIVAPSAYGSQLPPGAVLDSSLR
jgi:hypothetical protein